MFLPRSIQVGVLVLIAMISVTVATAQTPILAPGDFIIAIDIDPPDLPVSNSSSPESGNENVEFAFDQDLRST